MLYSTSNIVLAAQHHSVLANFSAKLSPITAALSLNTEIRTAVDRMTRAGFPSGGCCSNTGVYATPQTTHRKCHHQLARVPRRAHKSHVRATITHLKYGSESNMRMLSLR
jgi:hypothetical protein